MKCAQRFDPHLDVTNAFYARSKTLSSKTTRRSAITLDQLNRNAKSEST